MIELKYERVEIENMLECCHIKDANGENGYSEGIYADRVALNGFYLKAKRGSLLERIENMYVTKFQLENDVENFRSQARLELWLSINKYYDKFGFDENVKADGFLYTDCRYKAMDMAKLAKSNVSVCDRSTGKYHINKIESYEKKFIEDIDKLKNQRDERFLSELYNGDFTEDEYLNDFRRWLNENMDNILTKKQADYLRGDLIIDDVSGCWRINKNIASRVEKAYAQSKAIEEKIKKLNKQLKAIEYVLDFKDEKDFLDRLIKLNTKNKMNLLVCVYEGLTMDDCKLLTSIINKEDVEVTVEFYYDIIAILSYKELEIKTLIEEMECEE